MKSIILESKIQVPALSKPYIYRHNLYEILENAKEKIIILNAGAGFGKTALLTYYANISKNICVWYYIGAIDNDVITFMRYICTSVSKKIENFSFSIEKYYDNSMNNKIIEEMAYEFCYYLTSSTEQSVDIILDDFQNIVNDDIIVLLCNIINNSNDNIKFFISLKSAIPKFAAKYLFNGMAMIIGVDKLAFNRCEVDVLLEEMLETKIDKDAADFIYEYTEGWPVGVMSIALIIKQGKININRNEIALICQDSAIYDYIMNEVYKKIPYDLQTFLVNTSFLNYISEDICNYILNIDNAKEILNYLVQENYFVLKLLGKKITYRYHSIFKDFLNRQINSDKKRELLKKVSQFYLSKNDIIQAMEFAIQSKDIEIVSFIFENKSIDILMLGMTQTVKSWINYLKIQNYKSNIVFKYIEGSYYSYIKEYKKAKEVLFQIKDNLIQEEKFDEYLNTILELVNIYIKEKVYENAQLILKEALKNLDGKNHKYIINVKFFELYIYFKKYNKIELLINEIESLFKNIEKKEIYINLNKIVNNLYIYIKQNKYTLPINIEDRYITHYFRKLLDIYYLINFDKESLSDIENRIKDDTYDIRNLNKDNYINFKYKKIYILCLGNFEVIVNNEKVKWRTKKAKEMFAFLFNQRGIGVNKEQISDSLWENIPYNNKSTLFHTTLSYVRKALMQFGFKEIIICEDKKYLLDFRYIESDSIDFENICGKLNDMNLKTAINKLEIYKGNYMGTLMYDWCYSEIQKYEHMYINAIENLANICIENKNYEFAINLFNKILEINPYSEKCSIAIIKCFGLIGDKKKVKEQFEKTKNILKNELDVDVSYDIKKAYQESMQM